MKLLVKSTLRTPGC